MTKFKKVLAGAVAVATMASLSIPVFADNWEINYTQGAPSSISNQVVRREYVGLPSETNVYVNCNVTVGSVVLKTTGFNPNENSVVFYAPCDSNRCLKKPNPLGCSVELIAADTRVVANGYIIV